MSPPNHSNPSTQFGIAAVVAVLVLISIFTFGKSGQGATDGDPAAGKVLYWKGLTVDGTPTKAVTGAGIVLSGTEVSCVNCHRPSGFGSSEGGTYVLPITGSILFAPRELNRNRTFHKFFKEAQPSRFSARLREPRMRPAYTPASLKKALVEGLDPANQTLDPEMPRYQLGDADLANLTAYLKTLSAKPDPGVTRETIRFATVVSDDADPDERDAVLATISTFFDWMNTRVQGNRSRPNYSPNYHSDFQNSFQRWELNVWHVHGPAEGWRDQLQAQYQQAPVFAVVSGVVRGSWTPVGRFCDAERIPCIFPNTELPDTNDPEYGYSLYFSRGLELEAEALARYLADQRADASSITQIHSNDEYGFTPARRFAHAVRKQIPRAHVHTIEVSSEDELRRALMKSAQSGKASDVLVVWPGKFLKEGLADLRRSPSNVKTIYLPADALENIEGQSAVGLPKNTLFIYPYELPSSYYPRVFRVRQWMNSRKLPITHARLQFQTYYALTLLQFGLDQILDDYYRDYLIEAIEHEAESHLDNGTHPNLALGSGQRFASKGAYIVKADPSAPGGLRSVSMWIVP